MGSSSAETRRTHIVGAGLAGLSAAISSIRAGQAVTLYEAGGQAGGRCRSYHDARLDCLIDNGNHLLLSGNRSTHRYLAAIRARDALTGPHRARFPFLDLRSGRRWSLRPNASRIPWWILDSSRRVPGTSAWSYLSALRFAWAGRNATVTACVGNRGTLFRNFWEPLAVAALNTEAQDGAARLLWPVLCETFARGEAACRPRIATTGLSHAFVDPALRQLREQGADVRLKHRLLAMECRDGNAVGLDFGSRTVRLRKGDSMVLAVPPSAASRLMPELTVPDESKPIVNVHFRLSEPAGLPDELPILGLIGGTAQWLFTRGDIASVTISAAGGLVREPAGKLARKTWHDVAVALSRDPAALPPYRVVKEKRATIAQTPAQARRRPGTSGGGLANVFLAGDWTDTGLPATIEGAIRSGELAAQAAAQRANRRLPNFSQESPPHQRTRRSAV